MGNKTKLFGILAIGTFLKLLSLLIITIAFAFSFPTSDTPEKPKDQIPTKEEVKAVQDVVQEVPEEPINIATVIEIVDGDTVKVRIDGKEDTVRLVGIDTPENGDCYFEESSAQLSLLLLGKQILYEYDTNQDERDRYSRLLWYIWDYEDESFINKDMVERGYAKVYRGIQSDKDKELKNAEADAIEDDLGLWGYACACIQGEEESSSCVGCDLKRTVYNNWDCSTYMEDKDDSSCSNLCPVEPPPAQVSTPIYTPPPAVTPPPVVTACLYSCSGPDRNCADFSSHSQAQTFFNCCGFNASYDPMRLDGDNDNLACESI